MATSSEYRSGLRGAIRGFWNGVLSYDDFYEMMIEVVRIGLTNAWNEGMKIFGLKLEDMSGEEKIALQHVISTEYNYIDGLATAIEQNKESGGQMESVMSRADLWVQRWTETMNLSQTMAGADQPMEWVMGPTQNHCSSCLKLNGKVKRGSTWLENGIMPQSRDLECGGWKCQCGLYPTLKPLSRGSLPTLP